jgi:hypothetical protein
VESAPAKGTLKEMANPKKIVRNALTGAAFATLTPVAKYYADLHAAKKGRYY